MEKRGGQEDDQPTTDWLTCRDGNLPTLDLTNDWTITARKVNALHDIDGGGGGEERENLMETWAEKRATATDIRHVR